MIDGLPETLEEEESRGGYPAASSVVKARWTRELLDTQLLYFKAPQGH